MNIAQPHVLSDLVDEYLDHCANRKGLRPYTVYAYRHSLDHFVAWWPKPLEELEAEDIENFAWRTLKNGNVPSNSTARRELASVKKFLDWCAGRKRIQVYAQLVAVAPKVVPGIPKPVADEHWAALWQSQLAPDDRLWVGLAYFCGFRRYEIVTVQPKAVVANMGHIRFERKGGKNAAIAYRDLPRAIETKLPWLTEGWEEWAELLEWTAKTRTASNELHLSTHAWGDSFLDGNRLSKHLTRHLLPAAGLDPDSFTIHQMRHSCATNLFRVGLQADFIQAAMSHSSYSTTKGYVDQSGHLARWIDSQESTR
jgi:site-specific recombinase XerD